MSPPIVVSPVSSLGDVDLGELYLNDKSVLQVTMHNSLTQQLLTHQFKVLAVRSCCSYPLRVRITLQECPHEIDVGFQLQNENLRLLSLADTSEPLRLLAGTLTKSALLNAQTENDLDFAPGHIYSGTFDELFNQVNTRQPVALC